jgi:hypothetical protein
MDGLLWAVLVSDSTVMGHRKPFQPSGRTRLIRRAQMSLGANPGPVSRALDCLAFSAVPAEP